MTGRTRSHYSAEANFGGLARLNNLANDQAVTLGTVNLTSVGAGADLQIYLRLVLGASGVSPTGHVALYLLESLNNTTWRDGINGNVTGNQAANIKTLRLLLTLGATVNNQVIEEWFSLVGMKGDKDDYLLFLRPYVSLLVLNKSGATFAGTGHGASYVAGNLEVFEV